MKKIYLFLLIISLTFVSFYALYKNGKRSKLYHHYSLALTVVRYGLVYGSLDASKEELERFEDQLHFFMHLDGYNAYEISNMKVEAMLRASKAHRDCDNAWRDFSIKEF